MQKVRMTSTTMSICLLLSYGTTIMALDALARLLLPETTHVAWVLLMTPKYLVRKKTLV
jgi:hypothetical protein